MLNEIKEKLGLEIQYIKNQNELNSINQSDKYYTNIISKTKINLKNAIIINNLPIKITDLIERINLSNLKFNFKHKSNFIIGKYKIDINSRKITDGKTNLKLTEKEVNILLYLNNYKKNISIKKLQNEIWKYNSNLETHTVETHIYRIRSKIKKTFNDDNFIKSNNYGYSL